MYAIAQSGGKQFKIQQNSTIRVPSLKAAPGDKVRLDSILLLSRDNGVAVGAPFVEGAYAEARVVRHGRGPKIRIIKYKRRKDYHRTIGHRQDFTELVIDSIIEGGEAPQSTEKAESVVEAAAGEVTAPKRSRKKSAVASGGEAEAKAE